MRQSPGPRTALILVLVAALIVIFIAVNHRPAPATALDVPHASALEDLSAELRRCSALGPQDAEDQHCQAVWEENRRRFFGEPARSLPSSSPPGTAAPATASLGDTP